jgi:hypothetical protein
MPRGGRRPGAGAPKGNLNALTTGRSSKRVQAFKLALQLAPATTNLLRGIDASGDNRRQLFAMALQYYADLILMGDPAAIQSMETGQVDIPQIREFLENAKNAENNQSIKAL